MNPRLHILEKHRSGDTDVLELPLRSLVQMAQTNGYIGIRFIDDILQSCVAVCCAHAVGIRVSMPGNIYSSHEVLLAPTVPYFLLLLISFR